MERGIVSVKELRQRFGMTRQEFADYFGISVVNISNWENGTKPCTPYLLELMSYKLINELAKNNHIDTSDKKACNVKELRSLTKMNHNTFATYFDISKSTIQRWEYGKNRIKPYLFDLMYYKLKAEGLLNKHQDVIINVTTVNDLRRKYKMSQREFGEYFKIPKVTIISWDSNKRKCPKYLFNLMIYKLTNEFENHNHLIITDNKYDSIKDLRVKLNWTQQNLADYFEIPLSTVGAWESNKGKINPYLFDLMYYKLKAENLID